MTSVNVKSQRFNHIQVYLYTTDEDCYGFWDVSLVTSPIIKTMQTSVVGEIEIHQIIINGRTRVADAHLK